MNSSQDILESRKENEETIELTENVNNGSKREVIAIK